MYKMLITDTETDESKIVEVEGKYNWWLWNEGNYECDCNRGRMMYGRHHYHCNTGDNRFLAEFVEGDVEEGEVIE